VLRSYGVIIVRLWDMLQKIVQTSDAAKFAHRITTKDRGVCGTLNLVVLIAWATTLLQVRFVQPLETDMRILQNNIQSVSASLPMLRQTLQRLDIDVVLLQEVWHIVNDCINVRNYTNQYVRLRQGREGVELLGGVAILTHRRVKAVKLREFEVDNLQAV